MHRSPAGVAGRTGLAEDEAPGFDLADGICRNHDRSPSISVTTTCALRLMVERGSSLQGDMAKRIDSAVLSFGGTVDQLAVLDLGYAPPYSMPADPLQQTADLVRPFGGPYRGPVPVSEIPRDKPVVVGFPLGTRAYEAARILTGTGFPDVPFLEGGLQDWPYDLD